MLDSFKGTLVEKKGANAFAIVLQQPQHDQRPSPQVSTQSPSMRQIGRFPMTTPPAFTAVWQAVFSLQKAAEPDVFAAAKPHASSKVSEKRKSKGKGKGEGKGNESTPPPTSARKTDLPAITIVPIVRFQQCAESTSSTSKEASKPTSTGKTCTSPNTANTNTNTRTNVNADQRDAPRNNCASDAPEITLGPPLPAPTATMYRAEPYSAAPATATASAAEDSCVSVHASVPDEPDEPTPGTGTKRLAVVSFRLHVAGFHVDAEKFTRAPRPLPLLHTLPASKAYAVLHSYRHHRTAIADIANESVWAAYHSPRTPTLADVYASVSATNTPHSLLNLLLTRQPRLMKLQPQEQSQSEARKRNKRERVCVCVCVCV